MCGLRPVTNPLTLIQPKTLKTLATLDLPEEPMTNPSDFRPSGTYFYQDSHDRIVIGTAVRDIPPHPKTGAEVQCAGGLPSLRPGRAGTCRAAAVVSTW